MSNIQAIKNFIKINQERFLFVVIVILVVFISFRAGEVKERERKSADLKVIINNQDQPTEEEKQVIALGKAVRRKGLIESVEVQNSLIENTEQCQFIGSKNSDKYHLMSCRFAKQIKPENRVCFKSIEEAEKMGYKPASCYNK